MLSIENNELLTRVGPGTPMGTLMRHYWQPVCGVDDLLRSPFRTHAVKVLGEELVVYRDRLGHLGVVDKYCTHRRASLAYGVPVSAPGTISTSASATSTSRRWPSEKHVPADTRSAAAASTSGSP